MISRRRLLLAASLVGREGAWLLGARHPLSAYRQGQPAGPCTYFGMWSWTCLPSAVSANFLSPQAPRVSCRPPTFAIVLEQENGCRTSAQLGIQSKKLGRPEPEAGDFLRGLCRIDKQVYEQIQAFHDLGIPFFRVSFTHDFSKRVCMTTPKSQSVPNTHT